MLLNKGYSTPIIGDFHFNGHRLLEHNPACAEALDKYRINPGNVGRGKARDPQFQQMVEYACKYNKPVRIGVNGGSLDPAVFTRLMDENGKLSNPESVAAITRKAIVMSALESAAKAEEIGLGKDKIILSCKISNVQELIQIYEDLASRCNYTLHLGLTEAGMGSKGIVSSSAAVGRSYAARYRRHHPHFAYARTRRISYERSHRRPGIVADDGLPLVYPNGHRLPWLWAHHQRLLPAFGARHPNLFARPNARLAQPISGRRSDGSRGHGLRGSTAPGESKSANIGISLPGTGESPVAPVYEDGVKTVTLKGDHIAEEFQGIVQRYIETHYGEAREKSVA